jgi:hypothetical protein
MAGKGDHPKGGGRGAGLEAMLVLNVLLNVNSDAPSTMLRMVPLPRFRGGG